MKPPAVFSSPTAEWHNASYDAISPSPLSLYMATKIIVITGSGRGIGDKTVRAFAIAGAAHVALIGRTSSTLFQSKATVAAEFPSAQISTYTADVADQAAIRKIVEAIGACDVLILNVKLGGESGPIGQANPDDWWHVFEIGTLRSIFGATRSPIIFYSPCRLVLAAKYYS